MRGTSWQWWVTGVVFVTGSSVMFYLAAAVSDFYIPASEMPEHKIQSSEGPLQVRLPWAPAPSTAPSSPPDCQWEGEFLWEQNPMEISL